MNGGKGGEGVPVHGARIVVFGFERRRHVRVDPEGPQRVVEVEDQQLWEWEAVGEGGGDGGWGGEDGG